MARAAALIVLFLTGALVAAEDDLAPPETRAAWVDTWHAGILSASQIDGLVGTLAGANYNTIIAEVRKCGDAYYDSAFEPRASNILDPPPFDPLGDLLGRAQAAGLEVHAWIVTYRIWNRNWSSPPPDHVWSTHPEWAMKDAAGSDLDGDYYNLDPGVPGVQDYVCAVAADLVSKYDVDGLSFDYIRYPSGYTWGYNEITRQRFFDEYGFWPPVSTSDPEWDTWSEYRRRQVTDLVRKCAFEILWRRPSVRISVDSIGWMGADPNSAYTRTRQYEEVYQDSRRWMEEHLIDANRVMNYKREYDPAQQADFRTWSDWIASEAARTGRHGIDGQAAYLNSIADSITQMAYGRTAGCQGEATYSYAVTNKDGQPGGDFFDAVRAQLYQEPAPVPDMPWKSDPVTGIVFGQAIAPGEPPDSIYRHWIYRAPVEADGPVFRTTFTDATGTFGFFDLPPGSYTVTVARPGGPESSRSLEVSVGQVVRQDFDLSDADGDTRASMDDCDETDGTVWSPPSEARNLLWNTDKRTLTWEPPLEPGGSSSPVYDTLRSPSASDLARAICVEAAGRDLRTRDSELPGPGTTLHYLVRGDNGCPGLGELGWTSDGGERLAPACP